MDKINFTCQFFINIIETLKNEAFIFSGNPEKTDTFFINMFDNNFTYEDNYNIAILCDIIEDNLPFKEGKIVSGKIVSLQTKDLMKYITVHKNEITLNQMECNLDNNIIAFKVPCSFNIDDFLTDTQNRTIILTINEKKTECKLSERGLNHIKQYLENLKKKRYKILKERLDTAENTKLPNMEDILSDVETFFDSTSMDYTNNWGVTDELNSDFPLYLQYMTDILPIK